MNILWAVGAGAEPEAALSAFSALAGAARLAAARWPEFYRDPALARLFYARADPPAPAILAAAQRAGLVGEPCERADGAAGAQCQVAILASRDFGAIPERLPALIAAPGGAPMRLAARDAAQPHLDGVAPRRGDVAATPESLADALLAPPRGLVERRKLRDYEGEDVRARPVRLEYEVLLRLIGERSPDATIEDDAWDRAAELTATAGLDHGATLGRLRAEYERADALALAYGRRWRSTLAARSFLLFGANLLSGLIGTLFPKLSLVTLPVQFTVSALLFLDQRVSLRRRWRGKWIDYRHAAEATRIARFCVLAGAPLLGSTPPSWIDWRLERIVRRGEPAALLSDADAGPFLAYLREVEIERQIAYHRGAFRRFRRLNARLRRAAVVALLATIAVGAVLAMVAIVGVSTMKIPVLGAIGLALSAGPGLYAALNGLRGQLDVERQASRAARIGLALRGLRRALDGAPPSATVARAAATRAAEIMHEDVSSWDRVMEIV
ncbi:MAG TPA: hypothetical protein VEF36_10350 [Roseiarcus sp.]|nr:hypothetical protein [Roseiarcus sp.]